QEQPRRHNDSQAHEDCQATPQQAAAASFSIVGTGLAAFQRGVAAAVFGGLGLFGFGGGNGVVDRTVVLFGIASRTRAVSEVRDAVEAAVGLFSGCEAAGMAIVNSRPEAAKQHSATAIAGRLNVILMLPSG
ncbi:hypothetical protein, partial [Brevibacterium paucivorans]|uniref:hypothetical protein n=1 Tax=Brevibacterium paucivorans TaxID=170994 RepID=UPI0015E0A959